MIRIGFLLAIALLLAGCAGVRIPSLLDIDPEERQVIQLVNYAQRVATMTAEQQRHEYNARNQAFAKDKDANSRIRLALLLATPGASVHDAARAASLLEPMATPSDAASPLRSLARLIYVQLNERVSEQKRTGQMREQLEAQKEVERSMREKLDAQKEVERTMREQLDALKEVERTIMERGQESPPRRK